ncbi:histidine-containing phosphotransfer protein 1-like isoform X2 [Apium graveolens]|uniref:histidine-containing phosphotransfer protein 1-like isoform X2 n=1 Tax=Apium graveolens TaxID=4045 RepID=UPI003D797826
MATVLARIQQLQDMGLVDAHLRRHYIMKEASSGESFSILLLTFCTDVSTVFVKMDAVLNDNEVDYRYLNEDCMKLEGYARGIGALRLMSACLDLHQASKICSRDWCLRSLNEAKSEYASLKTQIDAILQMEWATLSESERAQVYDAF